MAGLFTGFLVEKRIACQNSVIRFRMAGGPGGGHACGFLFNFSKVTENANNDKTIDFFPHLQ